MVTNSDNLFGLSRSPYGNMYWLVSGSPVHCRLAKAQELLRLDIKMALKNETYYIFEI